MRFLPKLALAALAAMFASSAYAAEYEGISPSQLEALMNSEGVGYSSVGTRLWRSSDGVLIWLTECRDTGLCNEIRFSRTFSDVQPTLAAVNQWNNKRRVPEASIDDDGDLHLEMWLSTIGMTETIFVDTMGWFDVAWRDDEFWGPFVVQSADI